MIDTYLNAAKDTNFNKIYFQLNKEILAKGKLVKSRNGDTRELLNFKTIITNPYQRCVGGYGRDVNIFFLLAEALWIWAGRKDVAFLDMFNSNMKNYSDDGKVFHAPYGFRMRNWGARTEERTDQLEEFDQIADALKMLSKNPDDRRVVVSIWNPEFDLNVASKDIPCNDLIMFKIREGKLYTTVQNRSNDLHWGLLTNIFQFSFISNIMAEILGVELGEQVHNSQSLHVYTDLDLLKTLESNPGLYQLYDEGVDGIKEIDYSKLMKFNFSFKSEFDLVDLRLIKVDMFIEKMIIELMSPDVNDEIEDKFAMDLCDFSPYLFNIYNLLTAYLMYKKEKDLINFRNRIWRLCNNEPPQTDIFVLALNFVYTRMSKKGMLKDSKVFLNL